RAPIPRWPRTLSVLAFFVVLPRPPRSSLFPYTTLFRSSLVGSIVGNSLLVLGAAMLAGGWTRTRQTFDRTAAQTQAGMLLLTVVALALPSVLQLARHLSLPAVSEVRHAFGHDVEQVSV